MADPTATPRTFTEEELSRMPPSIAENIRAALAIINAVPTATPTPTPSGTKKPDIKRVSAPAAKPKVPMTTPTKAKPIEGVDFVYNEYGDIVTSSDPEFENYSKLWRARLLANKDKN